MTTGLNCSTPTCASSAPSAIPSLAAPNCPGSRGENREPPAHPSRSPPGLAHRLAARAAVLGANDGIVSTASLIIGAAAANAARGEILGAGVAGLGAGAMSMAAGGVAAAIVAAAQQRSILVSNPAQVRQVPGPRQGRLVTAQGSRTHSRQRMPVPVSTWQPWTASAAFDADGVQLRYGNRKWPVDREDQYRAIQRASAIAWARLFGIPLIMAFDAPEL